MVVISVLVIGVSYVIVSNYGKTLVGGLETLFDETTVIPRKTLTTKENKNIEYIDNLKL